MCGASTARTATLGPPGLLTARSGARPRARRRVALLKDFLAHKPQGALKAKELAVSLARLAQQIRDVIIAAFQRD